MVDEGLEQTAETGCSTSFESLAANALHPEFPELDQLLAVFNELSDERQKSCRRRVRADEELADEELIVQLRCDSVVVSGEKVVEFDGHVGFEGIAGFAAGFVQFFKDSDLDAQAGLSNSRTVCLLAEFGVQRGVRSV
ncbi:MAG: hypothetical protein O2820_26325 [Planctomycetota bacterium]|nr:hypothetical protein [Planctomycetota bacterium]